MFIYTGSDSM